jgi:hypothetical protein
LAQRIASRFFQCTPQPVKSGALKTWTGTHRLTSASNLPWGIGWQSLDDKVMELADRNNLFSVPIVNPDLECLLGLKHEFDCI